MDIKEFFEQSTGKWFAQRTHYNLSAPELENSKSELTLEILSASDSQVIQLCEQHSIEPTSESMGIKISWDNSVDWGKAKNLGSTLVVLIPNSVNTNEGQLLRQASLGAKTPQKGRYLLNPDESLTLIVEDEKTHAEERLWFVSPNVRLRTTLVKNSEGYSQAAFYSEIRKIPPKPQT